MTVFIDNRSGQPIYEQIAAQIRSQILKAELAADEALPSIRSLAKDLGISRRAISKIEKGEQNPSLDMAYRIAAYYNLSVQDVRWLPY